MDYNINFPHLGIFLEHVGKNISIGNFTIAYYGIVIAIGMLIGMRVAMWRAKETGQKPDDYVDIVLIGMIVGIIGARIYYVIFEWEQYKDNPLSIFAVWEGGLAIYGGILAGLALVIIWCRARRIPFGALGDLSVYGLLIGQSIGRWGNFLNREAFGAETNVFCRMGLTLPGQETVYVHPTFLYESLWNLTGFLILHIWFEHHKRRFDGHTMLLYVAWYGIGRMLIEGLRTDSLYLGGTGIRVSQLLAGVSALAAIILLVIFLKRSNPPLYVDTRAAQSEKETDTDAT
jgi:phosphatidylglycerol:prolipoprotein diacylglycerol transferase